MSYLLVFLVGLVFEGLYLAWFTASGRGLAKTSGALSALVGLVSFYGVSESIRDSRMLPAYLAGCALGSYLVVRLTDRRPGGKNTG